MKLPSTKSVVACALILVTNVAIADNARSEKEAQQANKLRHSVFTMLGANMGMLGAMAKGKIPVNAKVVEKNATRINQLSYMIADYTRVNTSAYKVKTDALPKVWNNRDAFEKRINDLTLASATLIKAAKSGNEGKIKSAIGGVGKTCGGCHDNFKAE